MNPTKFKEVNCIYAEDQPEYLPLPVYKSENGDVVSCWELTEEELSKIKETKCVFLVTKTFNQPLQPMFMAVDKNEVISE